MKFSFPQGREPFNGWSHLIAALLAVVGAYPLILGATDHRLMLVAKSFYAATLFLAFGSSALYHMAVTTPRKLRFLRNLDHIGIGSLMVGTYAPLAVAFLPNVWGVICFVSFSLSVLAGLLIANFISRRALTLCYILLACTPLIPVPFIWHEHWRDILWFTSGSMVYSLGAYCYLKKVPKNGKYLGFHGVWHILAMAGAVIHYIVIYHLP